MNSNIDNLLLEIYVNHCKKRYIEFMSISNIPSFQIVPTHISLDTATKKGFGAVAKTFYDIDSGAHKLKIWSELYRVNAEYLLFHEFTHILDAEMHSRRDKMKAVANKGYTEYHAAQIDLLRVLGAESVHKTISFSMNQEVETILGKKSALEYVIEAHRAATELISRKDFPADLETLVTTLGLIFNYLGRLSICKMYAVDYNLYSVYLGDTAIEEQFLGEDVYRAMDVFLSGWLSEPQIKILDGVYFKIIVTKGKGLL